MSMKSYATRYLVPCKEFSLRLGPIGAIKQDVLLNFRLDSLAVTALFHRSDVWSHLQTPHFPKFVHRPLDRTQLDDRGPSQHRRSVGWSRVRPLSSPPKCRCTGSW